MTSIATDSWEEQATEIRFSRKVRENHRIGSPSLSVNWIDPGQQRRRAPGCGADVEASTTTTNTAFTESEGEPQNTPYRKVRADQPLRYPL